MLKALMLRRKIDMLKEKLSELNSKDESFKKRESDLESSINEATTDEEQNVVSEEVEKFEKEKEAHEEEKKTLSANIEELENELEEVEAAAPKERKTEMKIETRGGMKMNLREIRKAPKNIRAFDMLTIEQRNAIVEKEDVKTFLHQIRTAIKEKRDIQGGDLLIPVEFLEIISENMYRYSKLIDRVRVRSVSGQARQTVAGTVPEAIWTESCGAINELDFDFGQLTVDGYKVAGFVAVCNSLLEDSLVDLAATIIELLSESLGMAKDKAILYGLGSASKMPLGIVTRLAQENKPSDYPATAPEWVDLHESNLLQIPAADTGATFWSKLVMATSAIANKYARGNKFWAMNSKTLAALQSKAITFTATGAIVAGVSDTLPVITGDIVVLEFMPDYDIVGGYGDLYLWAQRSGMSIEYDRSVQFIQDNTVFRGKERADGQPIIPQAFVAININGAAPTTAMPFPADLANDADLTALTVGELTLAPTFDPDVLTYTTTSSTASAAVTATPAQASASVVISMGGKNIKNGGNVTFSNGANVLTITVKNGNAVRVYTVTVNYTAG